MKRKGIRVALALVLSLVLLLGSIGMVEAKGNPHRTATLTPQATFDGAAYDLSFTVSWDAYRIQRILYSWWSWNGTDWVFWGQQRIFTFTKADRSWSGTLDYYLYHPQDVGYGDKWMAVVVLQKPKGRRFETVLILEEELVWP